METGSKIFDPLVDGTAGCGKTFITNFLLQYLVDQTSRHIDRPTTSLVCHFFCVRGRNSEDNVRALLKDLIMQVLTFTSETVRHIRKKFGSAKHEYDPSFKTSWRIFREAATFVPCEQIYTVIDALDEREAQMKSSLLSRLAEILNETTKTRHGHLKFFKIIISAHSRASELLSIKLISKQYHIDLETRPYGLTRDIDLYIDVKVDDLLASFACTQSVGTKLK